MAGRRPVEEAFVARRGARRLLVVPQRRQALERIVLHATNLRIPIVEVEGGSLTALAGFDGHQGVALVVEPRKFATIDDVLARAAERGEPPLILVLDSLEDPHNVGSLLRSAEGAGVHGVLFPVRRQAPLTPSAIKASAGAVEHLLLCPVDDLASALVDLHSHGVWVAGADSEAPLTARQTDLRGPIAIVVGSEGQGLGPAVRKRCDLFVRIPLKGAIGSLNAAVAGSVLLFEVAAQRDPDGTATRPAARNVVVAPVESMAERFGSPQEVEIAEVAVPAPAAEPRPASPSKGRTARPPRGARSAPSPAAEPEPPSPQSEVEPPVPAAVRAKPTAKTKTKAKSKSKARPAITTSAEPERKSKATADEGPKPESKAKIRATAEPKPKVKGVAEPKPTGDPTPKSKSKAKAKTPGAGVDDGDDDLLP